MATKVGNKIVTKRELAGLSRRELAEKVGVSDEAIRKIETGLTMSPRVSLLEKVAQVLETEVGFFLSGENLDVSELRVSQSRPQEFKVQLPFEMNLNTNQLHNLTRRLSVEFDILRGERVAEEGSSDGQ